MTKTDSTTNVLNLDAYRRPDELAVVRLLRHAEDMRKFGAALGGTTDPRDIQYDALRSVDELIALDSQRLKTLLELRELVVDPAALRVASRERIENLIADRDYRDSERESASAAVWCDFGLLAGTHIRDARGDIVDVPRAVAG